MNERIVPLIGMVLLSGSVAAQETVLYNNPYDPAAGSGNCAISSACLMEAQVAQAFTLVNAATIQSVSFTVTNPGPAPNQNLYNWAIYTAAGGLPTGSPGPLLGGNATVLPIASGQVWNPAQNLPNSFSFVTISSPTPPTNGLSEWTDAITFSTGAVNLGPGNYFLALQGLGSSINYESWDQGLMNTGGAESTYGTWSTTGQGYAMTISGKSAPEIDPSSTVGGLTLLFGILVVVRGRRPTTPAGRLS